MKLLKTSDPIGVTSEYVLTVQRQMILGRSRRHTMECRVYAALDSMLRSVAAMDSDKALLARGIWVHSRDILRVQLEVLVNGLSVLSRKGHPYNATHLIPRMPSLCPTLQSRPSQC